MNNQLEFLFEKSQSASKVKVDFVRAVQHEIRTPINHILSSTQIMFSEFSSPISKEHEEYVRIIDTSAKELLSMFNDLILLSDLSSGKLALNEDLSSVKALIDSSMSLVKPKFWNKRN